MEGGQPGFWGVEHRLRKLSAQGDPLQKLAATVNFEIFRADLAALKARDLAKGGRKSSLEPQPHKFQTPNVHAA